MLELEAAREQILSILKPLSAELVPLLSAAGRILAESIGSPLNLPVFDNSAMDGYAVRATDVVGATVESPVALRLIGQVAAGERFDGEVKPGTCVRLFTGSMLPPGADAVVMQEDTRLDPAKLQSVFFHDSVKPWENVRLLGQDVKCGGEVAAAGERVTAGRAALFAALGLAKVRVTRRPVVGILATGSELVEAGQALAPGKIFESNRTGLAILVAAAGAQARIYPLVPDTLAATGDALRTAFVECDVVLTSGGVSVGELDFVKSAFECLGGVTEFWRVAIKPGKPFVFGRFRDKILFGLPGNPVSAFVTFLLLVRPALLRLQSAREVELPAQASVLGEPLVNRGNRRHFMRVTLDHRGIARLSGVQASHALHALALANGLVDVPPNTMWPAGEKIEVLRIDDGRAG